MVEPPSNGVSMILRFENVRSRLPDFVLEANLALSGQVTGILGPSGMGKTTLLEILAGIRMPDAGRITLDDKIFADAERGIHLKPNLRGIGYVPQDVALFPHLSVRQNLRYGHFSRPLAMTSPSESDVTQLLEISDWLMHPLAGLSGGERQRVALGRALLSHPRLLLLDEPMSSLDQALQARLWPRLRQLFEANQWMVLYVSHNAAELGRWCDEVMKVDRGRFQFQSPIS